MILSTDYLYTFVSTGEKTAMYTLKVMCDQLIEINSEGLTKVVRNAHYIQNLSNDKDRASQKGQQLSEEMGLEFRDNADFDLNEIRRNREKQSKEEKEAIERAIAEQQAFEVAEFERQIKENLILVGKYKGDTPEEVKEKDMSYLFWMSAQKDAYGPLGVSGKIVDNYLTLNNIHCPDFIGTEGQELKALVNIKGIYPIDGYYGVQYFFKTIEQDTGATLGFYTTSKKLLEKEIGDVIELTGIVKEHRYDKNGIKTTMLSKPKLVPELKVIAEKKPRKAKKLGM